MDRQEMAATRIIAASPERVYRAVTEAAGLEAWQAPGEMTGTVHAFNLRVGGGYEMSLLYPPSDADAVGKSGDHEDRFRVWFVELTPPLRVVEAVVFDAEDPAFAGEMTMTFTFAKVNGGSGTEVSIAYENVPVGIRPEDNAEGTRQSLEKLAAYVENGELER